MKNLTLKLAVFSALGLVAGQAMSLGFESLPVAGFAVASGGAGSHQPTGGTTPYLLCNQTGNYGSTIGGAIAPTAGANNTCAIVPAPASTLTSPVAGFTLVTSANRTVTMNNPLTVAGGVNIGTLVDVVFRNAAKTECIYGMQISLTNVDYDNTRAGSQTFDMTGAARGGFSTSGTVTAAYARISATSDVVYRAGRTFTTVQHRAVLPTGSPTFAPGYYNLPLTPGSVASVNGVNASALSVPLAADQTANANANWVEFTTDVNSVDPDGSTRPFSPMLYVRAACTAAAPVAVSDAIRLRQTYQEQGTSQEFVEVRVSGFVPPGGTATPAVVPGSKF